MSYIRSCDLTENLFLDFVSACEVQIESSEHSIDARREGCVNLGW
jgi:hypothetical protein